VGGGRLHPPYCYLPPTPWIFSPSYGPVSVGNSSGLFEINAEASFVSSEKKKE